jgi:hypothetical protein
MESLLAAAWLLPSTTTSSSKNENLAQTHLPNENNEEILPEIPPSDVANSMEVTKKVNYIFFLIFIFRMYF